MTPRNKRSTTLALFGLAAFSLVGCSSQNQQIELGAAAPLDNDVPYVLTLEGFTVSGLPGLHSSAHAVHDGRLVLAGGRRNGMHLFPTQRGPELTQSFPPELANDSIFVVDLARRSLVGKGSVAGLPEKVAMQLRSTNAQYFTRDGWFFVVGGYTATADESTMFTIGQVLAIQLDALIASLAAGAELDAAFAAEHIQMAEHPALAITGGGIEILGNDVLLAFGHMFNGLYTTDRGLAQQEYSQSVRGLNITLSGDTPTGTGMRTLAVSYLGKTPDPADTLPQPTPEDPWHRRDYTLLPVLGPDGAQRIAAYGGVFKGGRLEGYLSPIYITPTSGSSFPAFSMAEDAAVEQLLSQYEGPAVPIYSASRSAMFTTFFGGISQYYWDEAGLKRDSIDLLRTPPVDGLPFINSVSTLRVTSSDGSQFLHVGDQFPPAGTEPLCSGVTAPYLGANSIFVPTSGLPMSNDVVLLDEITSSRVVGYVLGGIASTAPYPGTATCASDVVYAVTLHPGTTTRAVRLQKPGS